MNSDEIRARFFAGDWHSSETDIKHGDMVSKLAKTGEAIHAEMTPKIAALMHHVMGACSEAGELLDGIKKSIIYNSPIDRENIIEELGDMEFYMQGLRMELGITREETLEANMIKLVKRYPDYRYTNQRAQDRADKKE